MRGTLERGLATLVTKFISLVRCLALYEIEKARGTELPAIVGAFRRYPKLEEVRLRGEGRNLSAWGEAR